MSSEESASEAVFSRKNKLLNINEGEPAVLLSLPCCTEGIFTCKAKPSNLNSGNLNSENLNSENLNSGSLNSRNLNSGKRGFTGVPSEDKTGKIRLS